MDCSALCGTMSVLGWIGWQDGRMGALWTRKMGYGSGLGKGRVIIP